MKIINETMRHFDSFWFHGMILTEDVFGDLLVVDIGDRLHFQLTSFNYYNLFFNNSPIFVQIPQKLICIDFIIIPLILILLFNQIE